MLLEKQGISKLLELREFDDGFELEPAFAKFTYTGAEGFWTTAEMDWLIYASHESSITFGGDWLIEAMQSFLPEFHRYIYKGWDLALYQA